DALPIYPEARLTEAGDPVGRRSPYEEAQQRRADCDDQAVEREAEEVTAPQHLRIVGQGGAEAPLGRIGHEIHLGFEGAERHPHEGKEEKRQARSQKEPEAGASHEPRCYHAVLRTRMSSRRAAAITVKNTTMSAEA